MMKKTNLLLFFAAFIFCARIGYCDGPVVKLEPFKNTDRILIFVPHPDDEVIGCAGVIQEALRAGSDIHVLYLTNGDNNQIAFMVYEKRIIFRKSAFIYMGEVRMSEARKAVGSIGLSENNIIFLGYPDFGTFTIFRDHWQAQNPYKSLFTRSAAVPYKDNVSFGATYVGDSILTDLENTLRKYRPNIIFVSHPLDVNGDHRACYLFLEVALADLRNELSWPQVYHFLVHWWDWPLPRHYHPELALYPPKDLEHTQMQWFKYDLSAPDLEKKYKLIFDYKSQTESSAFYLLSFARKNELFSQMPDIDLYPPVSAPQKAERETFKGWLLSNFILSKMPADTEIRNPSEPAVLVSNNGPVSYGFNGKALLVSVDRKKVTNSKISALVYLFGYNNKIPFSDMPKIRIITQNKIIRVFDGKRELYLSNVSLFFNKENWVLKVPLALLKNPDFILAQVKGSACITHPDTETFRKINIRRK